jgi:hypothetical protein
VKNEQSLTRKLIDVLKELLPGSVVLKHTDQFTAGVPDLTVTWGWLTSWIEVKVVRAGQQGIIARGSQTLTMQQLAKVGSAWYVVYHTEGSGKTFIVHPAHIYGAYWLEAERDVDGLKHEVVAEFIKARHSQIRKSEAS